MKPRKLWLIITGGILLFFILFSIWIGGILLLDDKFQQEGITSGVWLYYILIFAIVAIHPLFIKSFQIVYSKKRNSLDIEKGVKISGWAFAISYVLLICMFFPIHHFEYILEWVNKFADILPYRRGRFWSAITILSLAPLFISLILIYITDNIFSYQQKTKEFLVKISLFIGTNWAVCFILGYISYQSFILL